MPRYLIERNFPDGLSIPMNAEGRNCHVTDRDGPPVNCMVNASALDPHICRA